MNKEKLLENLKNNGFEAYWFEDVSAAVEKAVSLIPPKSSVGWGGSMSCVDSGLIQKIKDGDFNVIDRDSAKNPEERFEFLRKCLCADYFLTGFNAVSENGVAVNIDGNGNRVAAISFGPKNVIALVGTNKICATEEEALLRAKTVAAPKNAVRFGKSPDEADSLMNIIQIIRRGGNGRIKILIVDEVLGY